MSLPPLWILRHGETEWNVETRLQGHLDSALTELGLSQARMQSAILTRALPAEYDVFCSPSVRALRTAEIALEGQAAPIVQDPDLMEIQLGDWQGKLVQDIQPDAAADALDDTHLWKFSAPNGESLDEMLARVTRVLNKITRPSVIVTHGLTSRLLRSVVLGLPPEGLSALPGGQGNVHYIADGQARVLTVSDASD